MTFSQCKLRIKLTFGCHKDPTENILALWILVAETYEWNLWNPIIILNKYRETPLYVNIQLWEIHIVLLARVLILFSPVPPKSSASLRGSFAIALKWKEECGKIIQICDRMPQLKKLERWGEGQVKMKLGSEAGVLTNESKIVFFQMYIKAMYLFKFSPGHSFPQEYNSPSLHISYKYFLVLLSPS